MWANKWIFHALPVPIVNWHSALCLPSRTFWFLVPTLLSVIHWRAGLILPWLCLLSFFSSEMSLNFIFYPLWYDTKSVQLCYRKGSWLWWAVVTANEACMTSLTAWERSVLYSSCSQAWAQQRQVLVVLQHLSHCSCWEALLFSRNSLGTLRYGAFGLRSQAEPNRTWEQRVCLSSAFPVPGGAGKPCMIWLCSPVCQMSYLYILLSEKAYLETNNCCKTGKGHQTSYLLYFPAGFEFRFLSTSDSWTFCPCLLCFQDHALCLHLNILLCPS